jgi:hypothetical protein
VVAVASESLRSASSGCSVLRNNDCKEFRQVTASKVNWLAVSVACENAEGRAV